MVLGPALVPPRDGGLVAAALLDLAEAGLELLDGLAALGPVGGRGLGGRGGAERRGGEDAGDGEAAVLGGWSSVLLGRGRIGRAERTVGSRPSMSAS